MSRTWPFFSTKQKPQVGVLALPPAQSYGFSREYKQESTIGQPNKIHAYQSRRFMKSPNFHTWNIWTHVTAWKFWATNWTLYRVMLQVRMRHGRMTHLVLLFFSGEPTLRATLPLNSISRQPPQHIYLHFQHVCEIEWQNIQTSFCSIANVTGWRRRPDYDKRRSHMIPQVACHFLQKNHQL